VDVAAGTVLDSPTVVLSIVLTDRTDWSDLLAIFWVTNAKRL
jgi:hypothetical protein